jgi:hypothetical protein
MAGSVTNVMATPVSVISASVVVADSSGVGQSTDKLFPNGTPTPVTLEPGQSVALAGGGTQIDSVGHPTVGGLTLQWTWPGGSRYLNCPSGVG